MAQITNLSTHWTSDYPDPDDGKYGPIKPFRLIDIHTRASDWIYRLLLVKNAHLAADDEWVCYAGYVASTNQLRTLSDSGFRPVIDKTHLTPRSGYATVTTVHGVDPFWNCIDRLFQSMEPAMLSGIKKLHFLFHIRHGETHKDGVKVMELLQKYFNRNLKDVHVQYWSRVGSKLARNSAVRFAGQLAHFSEYDKVYEGPSEQLAAERKFGIYKSSMGLSRAWIMDYREEESIVNFDHEPAALRVRIERLDWVRTRARERIVELQGGSSTFPQTDKGPDNAATQSSNGVVDDYDLDVDDTSMTTEETGNSDTKTVDMDLTL